MFGAVRASTLKGARMARARPGQPSVTVTRAITLTAQADSSRSDDSKLFAASVTESASAGAGGELVMVPVGPAVLGRRGAGVRRAKRLPAAVAALLAPRCTSDQTTAADFSNRGFVWTLFC